MIYYVHVMRCDDLCAVTPVSLIAIVLLRVVRRSDVYTALAAEMTDSKRQFRGRTEIIKEIYLDTVGRENIGYNLCKLA